ncbi:poly(A) polymerase Cid11 [Schizosaccharomyces cryophilus OY26]|uniref:polynucleotide adenylyltransferase n=1 Tax=Schizosaccharomyces cryophilus (strain OY26 / ATCC MYA-4695 / CBS 11777 / NBRC 106824 / NRRL Y48691) TaxID=653667 RepID=S9X9R8_SCHCR|nr:poly(A) polymerase Cid11 [Schizosaccharomyces cryophilus OY26]EPY50511.1 poly(A) polymerase Cid11 [Schizosaccharomyces cryophilus OY26]
MELLGFDYCPFESFVSPKRKRFLTKSIHLQSNVNLENIAKIRGSEELTKECWKLFKDLKPSPEENFRREQFIIKLKTILKNSIQDKNLDLFVFGSTESRLAIHQSDIDVCIVTRGNGKLRSTCQLAYILHSCMQELRNGMKRITCVPRARVPIVKMWDPQLNISGDININNDVAKLNTEMLHLFVKIDPRVRALGLIIKYWAKQRSLNDAVGCGTITSYTLSCMIVNFLQTRKPCLLPSMMELNDRRTNNIHFLTDLGNFQKNSFQNKSSLGELLLDFFRYYGFVYDYKESVVSVRSGTLLDKRSKGWNMDMNNSLCVEEPFNTSRNLANTADDTSVKGLQSEFQRAFRLLSEYPALQALSILNEAFQFPSEIHVSDSLYPSPDTPLFIDSDVNPWQAEAESFPGPYYPPQTMPINDRNSNFVYYIPDEVTSQESRSRQPSYQYSQTGDLYYGKKPPWHYMPCKSWLVWYPVQDDFRPVNMFQ